jgi:hypothetical protein
MLRVQSDALLVYLNALARLFGNNRDCLKAKNEAKFKVDGH